MAVLGNGLVHARQPREVAGMLTGVLLIAALAGGALPRWWAARSPFKKARPAVPE
jgi:hypothetical protein